MLVTNFYAQAACVVSELKESREIIKRLAKWDNDYLKNTIHPMHAEREHDAIISDARFLMRRYPNAKIQP